MKEIFKEIINEAANGMVDIDGDLFPIGFNCIIYDEGKIIFDNNVDNNFPVLIIKNLEIFFKYLNDYVRLYLNSNIRLPKFINEKNNIKVLISYLFVNATTEDFLNPIKMLRRNIEFLKYGLLTTINYEVVTDTLSCLNNSKLKIKNEFQSVFMETPYKIEISLIGNTVEDKYILPTITYGILSKGDEKICYIYTIHSQNQNSKDNKFNKKVLRELYKLNEGVLSSESDEYQKIIDNNLNYYPENISDIVPSAVLSLMVMLKILEKEGITKIKVVPYLPLRYLARYISAININSNEKAKELHMRNNMIQNNLTNKFIRTFRRLVYHYPKLNLEYLPYEKNEYMEMTVFNHEVPINNFLLKDVANIVEESLNNVKRK